MREDVDKLIWNEIKKEKMIGKKENQTGRQKKKYNEETKAIKIKPYEEEMETMKIKEKKIEISI